MKDFFRGPIRLITQTSLVLQILIGLILGIALAIVFPSAAQSVSFIGDVFVSALKAVAPVLVLVLVMSSIANHQKGQQTHITPILLMYVIGTLCAAVVSVISSFLFPSTLTLSGASAAELVPPSGISEVLKTLLMNAVDNPVRAVLNANYIGILAWAIALGVAFRMAAPSSRHLLVDLSSAVTSIVKLVIRTAPLGIFGIIAGIISTHGLGTLKEYAHLLMVLVGGMLFVALVVNPLLVFWKIRKNPYPLVLSCLRESGVTAFFTRSSAANIPVNLNICERLGLHKETYSISIPLGATINMAGAAITISVLTLATVHTLGIQVDLPTALLLCVVASVAACGASGVAGGSLLLIPLACSMFGISNDIAMQVVAIGFIIGIVQDSVETAVNSSTDVIFTAAVCMAEGDYETPAQPQDKS